MLNRLGNRLFSVRVCGLKLCCLFSMFVCKFKSTCFCKISSSFLALSTNGDGTAGWGTILKILQGAVLELDFSWLVLDKCYRGCFGGLVLRLDFRLDRFSCYGVWGACEWGLSCKLPEITSRLLVGKRRPRWVEESCPSKSKHRSLGCKRHPDIVCNLCMRMRVSPILLNPM